MMNAPIRYFGGKGTMLKKLFAQFPKRGVYTTFVDAYGGSGVVVLNKPYCPVEIYNDLDQNVYALYRVLHDKQWFESFRQRAELAIFHEAIAHDYRQSLNETGLSIIERAFRFWYVHRTFRSGMGGLSINTYVRRRMSKSTSDLLSSVDRLTDLHHRISSMLILSRDAIDLIRDYDRPDTFIYCDPPYVHDTRGETRYAVDADNSHHEQLVETLLELQHAKLLLSGYDNAIYTALTDNGWHRIDFDVNVVDGNNDAKTKTESVWRNYTVEETLPLFTLSTAEGQ